MSRRLTLLNFVLRHVGRPLLKRTKTPENARRDFDLTARLAFRGPKSHARTREFGGVPCIAVDPPGAAPDGLILYFHGGGYITGSARTHLPMLGGLAQMAGVRTVLPDYRLAPEDPFPAPFEDAEAVWDALTAETDPARIVLGGDSAGGGLALALMSHVLAQGQSPAGLFALSPWTDVALTGDSLRENAEKDAILPVERIEELRDLVVAGADPNDPRLSPLHASFEGAPPVYFQASETEILRDDTIRMADRLQEAGVQVKTDLWPDAPHVWQLFHRSLPEADDALARLAEFIGDCLRSSPPRSGS